MWSKKWLRILGTLCTHKPHLHTNKTLKYAYAVIGQLLAHTLHFLSEIFHWEFFSNEMSCKKNFCWRFLFFLFFSLNGKLKFCCVVQSPIWTKLLGFASHLWYCVVSSLCCAEQPHWIVLISEFDHASQGAIPQKR